jgi:hypothetical protein
MDLGKTASHFALALALALALMAPRAASAQSCGGAAGPPAGGGGSADRSWLEAGRVIARLSQEYDVRDRTYKGRDEVVNDFDETLYVSRTALELRYGLTDEWTAAVTPTYPHYSYSLTPPGGERRKFRFRGPGDTPLMFGRLIALSQPEPESVPPEGPDCADPLPMTHGREEVSSLALWAGVSLPTGEPEEPNPAVVTRDVSVSNLQVGTGTFDPLVRLRLTVPVDHGARSFAEFSAN